LNDMPEMPLDPFGAPEELIGMMRGLQQLHASALAVGLPEHVATQFIAQVFVSFSLLNNAAQASAPQE
jgi:hypothetical protein